MEKEFQKARMIGLMSGTSADGIDAVVADFEDRENGLHFELLAVCHRPWEPAVRAEILSVCRPEAPLQKVTALHWLLGDLFAEAALEAVRKSGADAASISGVASHGQTIWHQPEPFAIGGRSARGTLQIGEPAVIAARTGYRVVSDFRSMDMAMGGQGAPLVPIADLLLLGEANESRAIQNLGGISNVTYLPAGRRQEEIIAFDTGPCNMLLDGVTFLLTGGEKNYDEGGKMAAKGNVCRSLVKECLDHPYFAVAPPKSTGREMFGMAYAEHFCRRAADYRLTIEETLASATEAAAEAIARSYENFLYPGGRVQRVIAGGGGVKNASLMARLQQKLLPVPLTTHEEFGIPSESKEALAFALLGRLALLGQPGNIPSATGASRAAVLGKITLPP